MCGYYLLTMPTDERRERRWWVKPWRARRTERGSLHFLQRELRYEDPEEYKNYLRMDESAFTLLLSKVKNSISKANTMMRNSISPEDRLAVTLRFLATGETYKSLSQSTRISQPSLSNIIPEVCDAIYSSLREEYLKMPTSVEEWKRVSEEFYVSWNIPNTLGALDGKHIAFHAPKSAGSTFYNYKEFNSIVLLALVDASYGFLYIDVGVNGRVSDGGVFENSELAFGLKHNLLNLPEECPLPGMERHVPHVIVADAAFPLKRNIMKPFPSRNLTYQKRIYNYRKVVKVTLAACALHNFLRKQSSSYRYYDSEEMKTRLGRNLDLQFTGNHCGVEANSIRNEFLKYFNTVGAVPWQDASVRRGGG